MKLTIEVPDDTKALSVTFFQDNHEFGVEAYGTADIEKLIAKQNAMQNEERKVVN
jgi:hypothetical protein